MAITPYQCAGVKLWNALARVVPGQLLSPPLSTEGLLKAAQKSAGCSDYGSTTFVEPMTRLLESVEATGDLHAFGRFYVKQMVTGLLVNRLKLVELWGRHPEILGETVDSPLMILGLPRTGTSFLFNLLAQDPANRVLTNWEATVSQVPPEGEYGFKEDPRRKQAKFLMKFQDYLAPQMGSMHTFRLDGPEECTPLLMQEFSTLAIAGMFNVPSYAEWLHTAPHAPTYYHHKRILQTLQWKYPADRWVLKSPAHYEAIEALLEVYPDACVIQMHRDPVKAVASFASLCAAFRGIHSRSIDAKELGAQAMNLLADHFDRYLVQREGCDASRFVDLQYHDLVRDPLETVRRIYRKFDLAFSAEAEKEIGGFLSKDRRSKTPHRYDPRDFGLTSELIRERFQNYIEAFDIPIEN